MLPSHEWQTPMRNEAARQSTSNLAGSFNVENSTPRVGMTRSRREELELWRERKRQKSAEAGSNQPFTPAAKASGAPRPSLSEEASTTFRSLTRQLPSSLASSIQQKTALRPVPVVPVLGSQLILKHGPSGACAKPYAGEKRPSYGLFVRDENIDRATTPAMQLNECSQQALEGGRLPCTPMSRLTIETPKTLIDNNATESSPAYVFAEPILAGSSESSRPQHSDMDDIGLQTKKDACHPSEMLVDSEAADIHPLTKTLPESTTTITKSELLPTIASETKVEHEEYDVGLLLLANDTLVQHLAELEARRLSECSRLRQERDELRLELRMQDARFKMHAQRLEDTMQEGLMQALARVQQLTSELEEARAMIARLEKKPRTKRGQ